MNVNDARAAAVRLLSRREHARRELELKLRQRGAEHPVVTEVLDALAEEGLQSDARFAEAWCRRRRERLYGPLRIHAELRSRGIPDHLISPLLSLPEEDWRGQALEWASARLRGVPDERERARLYRAGRQRGYSHDQLMRALERLREPG